MPKVHKECKACLNDADVEFWDRREHRGERYDVVWDNFERSGVEWRGDRGAEYTVPIVEGSPFVRGDHLEKATMQLMDLVESGGGRAHECRFGRMPKTAEIGAFMIKGAERIPREIRGYLWINIRFTFMGSVDQRPGSRWEWVGKKQFKVDVPGPMVDILGPSFELDGYLEDAR